ncbi:hypothetical protein D3C73_913210 [compost metagenome]
MHVRRHVQAGLGLFDGLDRIGQRITRGDVERHRHRRQLLLVADQQRRAGHLGLGQRRQRDDAAGTDGDAGVLRTDTGGRGRVGGSDLAEAGRVGAGQCAGAIGGDRQLFHQRSAGTELRRHFQHHPVLVELGEDGRDLALAERIVERVVDGLHRHAQHAGLVAVDVQFQCAALVGQVVVDVGQFRALAQRLGQAVGLQCNLRAVHVRQRVLVLGGGHAGIQGHVLYRLQVQRHAGNAGDGLLQARQDVIQSVPIAALFQHDRQLALVERGIHAAGADEG